MALSCKARMQSCPHAGGPHLYAEMFCLDSTELVHRVFSFFNLVESLTLKNWEVSHKNLNIWLLLKAERSGNFGPTVWQLAGTNRGCLAWDLCVAPAHSPPLVRWGRVPPLDSLPGLSGVSFDSQRQQSWII